VCIPQFAHSAFVAATTSERILCDNFLCQNCDLRRIDQLVPLLFEALWKAMRAHYGSRELKADKIVKVKTLMTKALFSLPQGTFSHGAITQQLDNFVIAQGTNSFPKFMPAVDATKLLEHYSVQEREGVVRALIRRLDRFYAHHCPLPNCSTACSFAAHRCPNSGCMSQFSLKWWGEHDANCDWKDIPCPLQCGRVVVRRNADAHLAQECIMRPFPCPYARVGCTPRGKNIYHVRRLRDVFSPLTDAFLSFSSHQPKRFDLQRCTRALRAEPSVPPVPVHHDDRPSHQRSGIPALHGERVALTSRCGRG
jgi:hypothetical protein